mgnify:CR=1 FL=1
MKFSEVKEDTWIRYKENVYYVGKVHHDYIKATSLQCETIEISDVVFLTNNIELIEVPSHNVGDIVLYTGTNQHIPQTMVEVIGQDTDFPLDYRIKALNDDIRIWAAAFDIISVNY